MLGDCYCYCFSLPACTLSILSNNCKIYVQQLFTNTRATKLCMRRQMGYARSLVIPEYVEARIPCLSEKEKMGKIALNIYGYEERVFTHMSMSKCLWIEFIFGRIYICSKACTNEENESELASERKSQTNRTSERAIRARIQMNCIASHFVYIQNLSTLPHNVQTSMCFYINDVTDNNHWSLSLSMFCVARKQKLITHTHSHTWRDCSTYLCSSQKLLCQPIQWHELGAVGLYINAKRSVLPGDQPVLLNRI